jgi:glutathione peroxidase
MKTLPALALFCLATTVAGCSKTTDVVPAAAATTTELRDAGSGPAAAERVATDAGTVYQFTVRDINGRSISLSRFRGRKILIVNTASQCQYTPQYAELETLFSTYGRQVVVLGFPSNDFGGQEPGTDGQIATFCAGYHVTFPMFSKVAVVGSTATPLYRFLGDQAQNGFTSAQPDWNFCKYLIDESGHVMGFYRSAVTPLSPAFIADINRYPSYAAALK